MNDLELLESEDKNPYSGATVKSQEGKESSFSILRFFNFLFVLGFIGFTSYTVYLVLTQGNIRPIRNIEIANTLIYANGQDVKNAINEVGRLDYFFTNLGEITRKIENVDWVKSVSVEKRWPDTLIVKLEERIPYVRFGDAEFLDREGNRFFLPPSGGLRDLFRVDGELGTEKKVLAMYAVLKPWFEERNMELRSIKLDSRQNWRLYTDNNIEIILGKDDLNLRLKKLFSIYHNLIKQYKRVIQTIDLTYQDGGFSVRWKKGVIAEYESKRAVQDIPEIKKRSGR